MALHRVVLVALATVFSVGMTSMASACCGGGYAAPVAYPVAPVGYGYGCGGCGAPTAAAVYAQPVAPSPILVTPSVTPFGGPCCSWNGCGDCGWSGGWSSWSGGAPWGGGWSGWGWGRGGCGGCARPVVYAAPSLYVVNQGPVYSGPGLSIPYQTYAPDTAYVPATGYPYVPGYGSGYGYGGAPIYPQYYAHPYYRPHVAYRAPRYIHPRPRVYHSAPQSQPYP